MAASTERRSPTSRDAAEISRDKAEITCGAGEPEGEGSNCQRTRRLPPALGSAVLAEGSTALRGFDLAARDGSELAPSSRSRAPSSELVARSRSSRSETLEVPASEGAAPGVSATAWSGIGLG